MLKFHWDNVQSPEFVNWVKDLSNNFLLKFEENAFEQIHEKLAKEPKSEAEELNEAIALPNFLTVSPLGNAKISNLDFGSSPPAVSLLRVDPISLDGVKDYFSLSYKNNKSNESDHAIAGEPQGSSLTVSEGKVANSQTTTASSVDEVSEAPSTPRSSINCRSFSDVSETRTELRGPEHADEVPSLLEDTSLQSRHHFSGPFSDDSAAALSFASQFEGNAEEAEDFCIKLRVSYNGAGTGSFSAALQLGLPKFLSSDLSAPVTKPLASLPFSVHIYGLALCVDISVLVIRSEKARSIADAFNKRHNATSNQLGVAASVPSAAALAFLEAPISQLSKSNKNSLASSQSFPTSGTSSERPVPDPEAFSPRVGSTFESMAIQITPGDTSSEPVTNSTNPSSTVPFRSGFRQRRPISSASGHKTAFSSPEGPLLSARRNPSGNPEVKETRIPSSNRNLSSAFAIGSEKQALTGSSKTGTSLFSNSKSVDIRGNRSSSSSFRSSNGSTPAQQQPLEQRTQVQLPLLFVSISGGPFVPKNPLHFNDPDYAKSLSDVPGLSTPELRAAHLYDLPNGQIVRRVGLCVTIGSPITKPTSMSAATDSKTNDQKKNNLFQDKLQCVEKYLLYKVTKTLDESFVYPFILPVQLDSPS